MNAAILIGLFLGLAALTLAMTAEDARAKEDARGWRFRFVSLALRYEEKVGHEWRGIDFETEQRGHSISGIRFPSPDSWTKYPAWAAERRSAIIDRVKSEFGAARFTYEEEPNQSLQPTAPSGRG